ncbi:MAG: helix-turn-helix transcriptional regulator [Planctomycetota bacterium]|nr:helix-turn-helix transcriptional regulator [Planctomycetota bacterium]
MEDRSVELAARSTLSRACERIQVSDVVSQTRLTRRVLEVRFKSSLGITPHELITKKRIANAERLLRETNFSIEEIAHRYGFEYREYLNRLFKKLKGLPPGTYRRTHRANTR